MRSILVNAIFAGVTAMVIAAFAFTVGKNSRDVEGTNGASVSPLSVRLH